MKTEPSAAQGRHPPPAGKPKGVDRLASRWKGEVSAKASLSRERAGPTSSLGSEEDTNMLVSTFG
jgi:hypothetical protein